MGPKGPNGKIVLIRFVHVHKKYKTRVGDRQRKSGYCGILAQNVSVRPSARNYRAHVICVSLLGNNLNFHRKNKQDTAAMVTIQMCPVYFYGQITRTKLSYVKFQLYYISYHLISGKLFQYEAPEHQGISSQRYDYMEFHFFVCSFG